MVTFDAVASARHDLKEAQRVLAILDQRPDLRSEHPWAVAFLEKRIASMRAFLVLSSLGRIRRYPSPDHVQNRIEKIQRVCRRSMHQ